MGKKNADKANSAELNKAAGAVVDRMVKALVNKQIQDVEEDITLTNVKIINFDKPVMDVKQEGSAIVMSLNGISLGVEAKWAKEKDAGALTAPTKASVNLKITVASGGQLTIDSSAIMSEFGIRNDGDLSDANQDLLHAALRGKVKQNLESVICQSAVESINESKAVFNKILSVKAK